MKKKLLAILQFGIGAGLMTYIFLRLSRSGDLSKLAEALQSAADNWPLVVGGLLVFGVSLLDGNQRQWRP